MPPGELARHLKTCSSCREWRERVVLLTRTSRLRSADTVPDLTEPILASIVSNRRPMAPDRSVPWLWERSSVPAVVRLTLLLVAASQSLVALPALFGNDLGATIHVAHEQGAWGLALAAGLAFAAARPSRAAAMGPVLTVFVVFLGVMTGLDIAAGRVAPSAEVPHLMAAFGLVLLWLESHPPSGLRAGGWPAPRRSADRVAA
jgi:predicted anti-sigma-YlaC factor YlaD